MGAVISECGKYRYYLQRDSGLDPLVFIMLNPSTADATEDDSTIRRCRRFAKDLGYTGIVVVNLYGYRATNPKELKRVENPVGEDNDRNIKSAIKNRVVVCAWGNNADKKRVKEVWEIISSTNCYPHALAVAKTGMPKHPLYLPANSELIPYNVNKML